MNAALIAAMHAAQKDQASVDDLLGKLRKAGARSASSAAALPDYDSSKIDEAVGLGLVVRSADGRLHINESAVTDRHQSIGWTLLVVMLIFASVAASVIALIAL